MVNKDSATYFFRNTWAEEQKDNLNKQNVHIGFPVLDEVLDGLEPGIHVVGAPEQINKSAFAMQIADHVAKHDRDVIVFSLVKTREEMLYTSLARLGLKRFGIKNAFTVVSLGPDMYWSSEAEQILDEYCDSKAGKRTVVVECGEYFSPAYAKHYMKEYSQANPAIHPLVIVDSLNDAVLMDKRWSKKDALDRQIEELRQLSTQFDVPVLITIGLDKGKARGKIELEDFPKHAEKVASSVIALQYQDKPEVENNQGKKAHKVEIQAVVFQNMRNGLYPTLKLDYYPYLEQFWEMEDTI